MKKLLFLLITAFCCASMWAQCPQGGVTFYTQDDINDFISTYPNCTEIQGSVTVDCIFLFDGINSLNGLRKITNITNNLTIRDCDLNTLSGLSDLNTIGNDLNIENNDALTSLTGLGELVSVGRDLIIENNANLTNLAGLESLESVGRHFNIWESPDLVNLIGLENLSSVGGNLWIYENNSLSSLTGLNSLNSIGINLNVWNNTNLTTLTGIESLVSIGTDLLIQGNESLTTLTPLGNLNNIGGGVSIYKSDISTLEGLESITSIPDQLSIVQNYNLTSLAGLENLTSIGGLDIRANYDLAVCNISSVCNYLENGGTSIVYNNAPGCDSQAEIEATCMPVNVCPQGDVTFYMQEEVDNFILTYPACTELPGSLYIGDDLGGSEVNNLDGLANINTIAGDLWISQNYSLTTLDGLESLNTINGYLFINENTSLTSLEGLDSLDPATITHLTIIYNSNLAVCDVNSICSYVEEGGSATIYSNDPGCNSSTEIQTTCTSATICPQGDVGFYTQEAIDNFILTYPACTELSGNLQIGVDSGDSDITNLDGLAYINTVGGNVWIYQNYELTTLDGLQNLSAIGGYLILDNNTSLTSIDGLENIDPTTITNLTIQNNHNLAICDANSICDYLEEDGTASIFSNASGCDSQAEIEAACAYVPPCPQGDVSLYLQSEVDDFILTYPACTDLPGSLYIGDDFGDSDVNNLDGFANLTSIGGNLSIFQNFELTTLSGLQNLSTINGHLFIDGTALTSLEDLDNLDYTTISDLTIINNFILAVCDADIICSYLENGGTANISNNASGCDSQAEIEAACAYVPPCPQGDIIIWMQSEVDDFILTYPACTDLPGSLYIGDDTGGSEVFNLDGLANLTSIGGNLWISQNYGLSSLSGLQNLGTINGYLLINDNDNLTSLEGLDNLDPASISNLIIRYNSNLSVCDVNSICDYLESSGTASIFSNAPDCDSQAEIEAACTPTPPDNPCDGTTSTDSLTHIFDQDIFIDGIGFANNPTVTFTDPATPANAVLSDISLELYFRLNGSSCENEIAIQITDPAGNTQALTAFTTCDGGNGLYYVNLDVPSGNTTGSVADWVVEFDDTNDQNSDYEYSVRFARLNYVATTGGGGGETLVNEVSEDADMDLFIDGIGFENNGTYTFTDPATPANAVLSDISLELYFRLNGSSCENEIAIQITDPAGNTQPLTAYTSCDGGTGLFYVNLDVPSGNTIGSIADWVVEFDDTNDQNADYEYSVRFGRLTYTTTYTEGGGGTSVTVNEQISDLADSDLFIDGVGFANNDSYTFTDPGTPADAILSNISLELYFRLNGSSCENEIAMQLTDPAGNTQPLTAYTTCDGGTGLYYVNLDVPSGNTTGSVADWTVQFDDTNDQNSDYEYSVRFGRLTYDVEYTECVPMLVNENEAPQQLNTPSTQQLVNPSTRQLNNPSLKLYPVPASQHLNVEYFSEMNNPINIEVISNEGKTLLSTQEFLQEGLNTIQLDIAALPAGHYHIRMYNTDDIKMQSFVKIAP